MMFSSIEKSPQRYARIGGVVYLAIIAAYVVVMDRLEAAYLADEASSVAGSKGPDPDPEAA